jgi:hypothetical protein
MGDDRDALVRDASGHAEVQFELERPGHLVLEELVDGPAIRVDPAQQLALVEADHQGVVAVPGARPPLRGLVRQHRGEGGGIPHEVCGQLIDD